MSTQPTDALELLREIYADLVQGAIPNADDPWWQKTSVTLALWGAQPSGAGEVDRADAVNLARNCLGVYKYTCAITKKGIRVLAEAVLSMDAALYTTPQPTQVADSVLEDAERYRYLRDSVLVDGEVNEALYVHVDHQAYPNRWALVGLELDEAIDAARKQGANHD